MGVPLPVRVFPAHLFLGLPVVQVDVVVAWGRGLEPVIQGPLSFLHALWLRRDGAGVEVSAVDVFADDGVIGDAGVGLCKCV